jgi:hypothetical protein
MILSHLVTKTLWVIPIILLVVVAAAMLRRKLTGEFPVFFSYTVVVFSREIALLFLKYPGNLYALVYWYGEALAVLLGLGVIFETLRHIFPNPFLRVVLKSVGALSTIAALTALVMLILTESSAGADGVFDFILSAERSARFLQACLLIVVIALMSRLGLTWHHYSVGIVAGFGVYSAMALATLEFRSHIKSIGDATLVLLNSAAYNIAAIIWAFYFLRSWRRTPVDHLPKTDLTEWNEAVTDYVDKWYRR